MKYISMKMEPKGSRPPMAAMTGGRRYQARPGMGDGMRFTRHGLSGAPFQLRPTTCARYKVFELNTPQRNDTKGLMLTRHCTLRTGAAT